MELKLIIFCPGAIIRVGEYAMLCALAELPHYLAQACHAVNFSEAY